MLGNGPVIEEQTIPDPVAFRIRDIIRMPSSHTIRTLDHLPELLYPHLTQEITQFLRIVRRKPGLTPLYTRLQSPLVADLPTESGEGNSCPQESDRSFSAREHRRLRWPRDRS